MTPEEIIEDIWTRIPDWKETNEISEGLFRKEIAAYDKEVIRELVCNALVHRPYTISGDIFICIYPNSIEVKNIDKTKITNVDEKALVCVDFNAEIGCGKTAKAIQLKMYRQFESKEPTHLFSCF